ncbi:MAG: HlyD family secretion protein [Candidatus Azobacteroides sp.]|nr:HlyD family secretion protein [Candidatus Azobacteroides sp.]
MNIIQQKENNKKDKNSVLKNTFADYGSEIDEIISHRPPWVIRRGTLCFFFFLLVMGVLCWFINYPDIVTAQAVLTSVNAPKPVITGIAGKLIKINVQENDEVKQNQVLGYLESTADHQEVLRLAEHLDSMQQLLDRNHPEQIERFFNLSENQLGELQIPYQTFSQAFLNFTNYYSTGFYLRKKSMLLTDKNNLERLHANLLSQKELEKQDIEVSQKSFNANRMLRDKNVLAELDYNDEKSKWINKQMGLPQIENAIIGNESDQNAKQQEIAELDNTIMQQKIIFRQALGTLKSQIEEWKKQYLLIAPIDGKVTFVALIQENQQLQSNQTICYINPENTHYFVQLVIPQTNLGKVDIGQKVLLKFPSYPFQEYGAVYGKIEFISHIAADAGYFAKVDLQDGLRTNYGKQIMYRDGLQGDAEIITKDLRLLERFYYDIMKQIKR